MIIDNSIVHVKDINFADGHILLINKELNWTSFDVVNKAKRMIQKAHNLKKIKVGHGGTLDPLATGVMVIGIGKETKNLAHFQNQQKSYYAEITFGTTTPSYDLETDFDAEYPTEHIDLEAIQTIIREKFTGDITQIPPIYSAKNIQGVRAYKSAREGQIPEMKSQNITIFSHEVHAYNSDTKILSITVSCSKGTYIRSLAHDIGQELASGAHLSKLIRKKSGDFGIESCITIEQFQQLIDLNRQKA